MSSTIGNPLSWVLRSVFDSTAHARHMVQSMGGDAARAMPRIRSLSLKDLRLSLQEGYDDFKVFRSDVITICTLYPIIGISLAFLAFHGNLLHLVFPLLAGFTLLGPVAAMGMYEMSRRREAGEETSWFAIFDVLRSPVFGAILVLSLLLFAIFLAWLAAAHIVYLLTIGTWPPASAGNFLSDVFLTGAGWGMMILGTSIGFLFALCVLMISIVSFPLLLDRRIGVVAAVMTSVGVVLKNPAPSLTWGMIVAGSLLIGSLPALLGLSVVLPVLGHATWHLYRKAVV